jgi:hypothetical protein
MNPELDFKCPKCGKPMEVLKPEGAIEPSPNMLRVCPYCATLAWNNEDGTEETRTPQEVKQ